MRLRILSDLHLEFGLFDPPKVDADAVVLAGDVHPGLRGLPWMREAFPDLPILFVPGNHEYYGHKIPKLTLQLKEAARDSRILVLEQDRVELGDCVFLGATLWTDFSLLGEPAVSQAAAASGMTDFRRIRIQPTYSRFRPADARRIHFQTVHWLEAEFRAAAGRKLVVITHHAPSARSLDPNRQADPLGPAYASNLDPLVEGSAARLWIHGHIHRASDYLVGSTRVIANPRGDVGEPVPGFAPGLVVDV